MQIAVASETSQYSPDLGVSIDAAELDRLNKRDIFPDGDNLPVGIGTIAIGQELYQKKCVHCHGPEGLGGNAEALAGGEGALTDTYPDKVIGLYWPFATTLFDVIKRAMPLDQPASLTNNEVYSLTAYLLSLNGILLTTDALDKQSLQNIQMPNRGGFIRIYPSTEENTR